MGFGCFREAAGPSLPLSMMYWNHADAFQDMSGVFSYTKMRSVAQGTSEFPKAVVDG